MLVSGSAQIVFRIVFSLNWIGWANNEMILQKLNYIHHNPVEAGIVLSPEEYLYSNVKNYLGKKE